MSAAWPDTDELESAVLAAHAARNASELAQLYYRAGLHADELGDTARAGFLITNAYVNALECGDWSLSAVLRTWLVERGREADG